jgi:hypothetical protein
LDGENRMAITKRIEADKIEILTESGNIQVRTATIIEEDGNELSRSFHRHVRTPLCDCSNDEKIVQDLAKIVHTKEKKDAEKRRRGED